MLIFGPVDLKGQAFTSILQLKTSEVENCLPIRLFPEAITKRREENGGCEWLSDWQVHSAHITAGAIDNLASGYETGPLYVPMPTGSGKTTGAIWGIVVLDVTEN